MISMTSKTYFSSLFPYLNSLYACKIVKTSHELLYQEFFIFKKCFLYKNQYGAQQIPYQFSL